MKDCLRILVAGFPILISCNSLAVAQCAGLPQRHNDGHFVFDTYSWSGSDPVPGEVSFTCIVNRDPQKNDLPADWYIPGPSGYFPYGEQLPFPRRTDEKAEPIWGCLEYGSVGRTVSAQFLGDAREKALGSAGGKRCGLSASTVPPTSGDKATENKEERGFPSPLEGWIDKFRMFFPSGLERAQDTLLQFTANLEVRRNDDGSFTHTFEYAVVPYGSRQDGEPKDVVMEVDAPKDETQLAATLSEEVHRAALDSKGMFDFTVRAAEKFRFAPLLLTFKEHGERTIAHLQVSVLTPAE